MCFQARSFFKFVLAVICTHFSLPSAAQYHLKFVPVDSTSASQFASLGLTSSFRSRINSETYLYELADLLQSKGYPAASIDSVRHDSMQTVVYLYVGKTYQMASIFTTGIDKGLLEIAGWPSGKTRTFNPGELQKIRTRMLQSLENSGYPFARLRLDSLEFDHDKLSGKLVLEKGPLYKIDSIRIYGNLKIANGFLQRYLEIRNGSYYQKDKLDNISKKISELPFVEESTGWNMTMLGTGSIINLYLQQKKSSRVNVLIGLLPSSQQSGDSKLRVTGDADISLRNALGNAELIGINWQQIQIKSPRLNLVYEQLFLFGSPFGVTTAFDLFKKDSSFLNINFNVGVQSSLGKNQRGSIFLESLKTSLLTVDTSTVKFTKKLPPQADVSAVSLGINYQLNKTNYQLNPLRGTEVQLTASAGTRKVNRNSVILQLYEPGYSFARLYDTVKEKTYRLFLKLNGAHYFQVGRQSTIKAAINMGLIQSPSLFRNELFQIGGYRLLRGFDEESIYVSSYLVTTAEFRYLIARNSFLFTFIDGAITANKSVSLQSNNRFTGAGLGLALETKAGIFNISYAAGKRNDLKFDIRQSKIHIGYVNFF